MRKAGIFAIVATGSALVLGFTWIAVLRAEQKALLEQLRLTEDLLRTERQAAERAEFRHRRELWVLRDRLEEERRALEKQHDATVREVTAEALGAQVELIKNEELRAYICGRR